MSAVADLPAAIDSAPAAPPAAAAEAMSPRTRSLLRLVVAVGGGWLVMSLTGSLAWAFAVLALALVVYGVTIVAAIASGSWFRR